MQNSQLISEVVGQAPNRRSFVKKLGVATAAISAVTATKAAFGQASAITDFDILNFALNLEYLEAEFYTVATTGMTIDQFGVSIVGVGNMGATTGGSKVDFTGFPTVRNVAEELAVDERTHVALIQGAIASFGGQSVAKPAINLSALGFGYGSVSQFLQLSRIFESIGVSAYGGAAPLILDKTVLGYAARILAVEAFHTGGIDLLIAENGVPTTAVDGADILPPPSGTLYFPTDSNALSMIRTPEQVLYLAYNGASLTQGAFFPSGVNGIINMSSATPAMADGSTFTASPNPIPGNGSSVGITTLTWNAPSAQYIEIRVGSPTGTLFTNNLPSGSAPTGDWVTDGMMFFLQDVSNGKPLTAANTLATLIVHLA